MFFSALFAEQAGEDFGNEFVKADETLNFLSKRFGSVARKILEGKSRKLVLAYPREKPT